MSHQYPHKPEHTITQWLGSGNPAEGALTVTPSDSTPLTQDVRALYIGGTGDVTVKTTNAETVSFIAVPTGFILPIRCTHVMETGTTAEFIIALY